MTLNIEELRETLKINKSDMTDNRMLTNELIVDDIMVGLGYNKKRDTSVKRLYNSKVDWEVVTATGSRLAVKVYAPNEELLESEFNEAIEFCTSKRFSIFMTTNGESLDLYRFNKETIKYVNITKISIMNEISDSSYKVLKAISKEGFDLELIDKFITNKEVTIDEIKDCIRNNVSSVVKVLYTGTNAEEARQYEEGLLKLISEDTVRVSNAEVPQNSEDIEKLEQKNKQYEEDILELTNTVSKLTDKITEKNKEIEELKQSKDTPANTSEKGELSRDIEDKYREQIQKLSIDLSNATEEIGELKKKLEAAQAEIDGMSGMDRQRALDLLGVIEDNPELDRHYVGVIDTELIQFEDIHTFVGRSLQRLYELKNLTASQYIFNGDIFTLVQPATRNDLIMNNKAYDVEFNDEHEDETLNKLRVVFSHFDDIIFECKKIGTLRKEVKPVEDHTKMSDTPEKELEDDIFDTEEDSLEIGETEDNIEDIFEETEVTSDELEDNIFDTIEEEPELEEITEIAFDENIESDETEEEIELENDIFKEDSFDDGFDTGSDENDNWDIEENTENEELEISGFDDDNLNIEDNTSNYEDSFLVGQLLDIDKLIWSDEPITFENIKYIGTNVVTFNINMYNDDMTNEQLLCKCVDAVLAIEAYNGNNSIVAQLKQKDFSLVNNFLKLYTEEYRGYPRINGTKYAIVGIESIQSVASVLLDICNEMGIDTSEIFIYFDTKTSSEFIKSNYSYPEDAVQLRELTQPESELEENNSIAIIKGDMFNNIVVTKNSLRIHKEVLGKSLAIKTKYLGKVLETKEDLVEVVTQMMLEATKISNNINIKSIGNVIGEDYKLLSENADEVGENALEVSYRGETIYLADIEDWQVVHSLIKIHTTLFNNAAIAIKSLVNLNAIKFYGEEFETPEPSMSLAVKSFVDYVALCIKQ